MDKRKLLSALGDYKSQNAERYGIIRLGVFGSFARDEATVLSDVDIVLQTETPDPYTIVHIKEELEKQLNLPVDIVRFREKMNPYLKQRIEKEAVYV
jgi:uncharacterized protein